MGSIRLPSEGCSLPWVPYHMNLSIKRLIPSKPARESPHSLLTRWKLKSYVTVLENSHSIFCAVFYWLETSFKSCLPSRGEDCTRTRMQVGGDTQIGQSKIQQPQCSEGLVLSSHGSKSVDINWHSYHSQVMKMWQDQPYVIHCCLLLWEWRWKYYSCHCSVRLLSCNGVTNLKFISRKNSASHENRKFWFLFWN